AEDGIRDLTVTGVQTCALPIFLRELAKQLGIADQVCFAGKRQPDELRDFYGAGDVMVTTPWYEPFGLTPLEAMACERPVIGSARSEERRVGKEGISGWGWEHSK